MSNRTIRFDIKAFADTQGLQDFSNELKKLSGEAQASDRILGQAVKLVNEWAGSAKLSADNTAAAVGAIRALSSAMTAGGTEWKRATRDAENHAKVLRETVAAARSASAALAAPARTTSGAQAQISDLRQELAQLTIGSQQYLKVLTDINEREALLGRRTGRAGVIAANTAAEGALMQRGYGAQENLQAMPNTTAALNQRRGEIAGELPNLVRGTDLYLQKARELRGVERELARDISRSAEDSDRLAAARKRLAAATQASAASARSGFAGFSAGIADSIAIQKSIARNAARQPPSQYAQPIGPEMAPANFGTIGTDRFGRARQLGPQAPTELFQSIGGIASSGIDARLQTMGRSYAEVAQQIRTTAAASGNSTRALEAEKAAWDRLAASLERGTKGYREATRESRRVDRQLGGSGRYSGLVEGAGAISAGAFFGGPEGLLGGIVGSFAGPGGALAGASAGASLGIVRKSIGDTAVYSAQLEKLKIALQGVTGGGAEYAQALDAVNRATVSLNITQADSLTGFTRLTAAVVGAGGRVADAEIVFNGVSQAIKATGGSSQDVQSALLAMAQVFSKGKVSAEELQGQLGERLPGAVTLFAQATGRTLPQLSKDLQAGTVGLNDLMKFAESLSRRYADTAQSIAGSSAEAGARLAVTFDKLRIEVGKAFEPIGAYIQNATNRLTDFGLEVVKTYNIQRMFGGKVLSQTERSAVDDEAARMAALRQPRDLFKRNEEFQRIRAQIERNRMMQIGYDTNVIQPPTTAGTSSSTNFADPRGNGDATDKARRDEEKRLRQAREAASRQQRLDMQLHNDQVRLAEQLAENKIRLEDRVFEHKQELMRRERDMAQQLDDLRLQNFINKFGPEGRNALGPLADLLRSNRDRSSQIADAQARVEADRRALQSAREMEANRKRFGVMYRADDITASGGGMVPGGRIPGGAFTRRTRDPDAEATGWDIVHSGGRGAAVRAPLTLTITGTGFQGSGAGSSGRGYGNWVSGEFELAGKRYELLLGHFDRVDVAPGMRVPAGGVIGSQGITGRTFGTHVTTHVNPKGGASVGDAWNALDAVTRIWERGASGAPGATTTLANGSTIRTTGAAAAGLRGASAEGGVQVAQQNLKQSEAALAQLMGGQGALSQEQLIKFRQDSIRGLKDQQQAVEDNAAEWRLRNRYELEGMKPEMIEFELQKEKILREQTRAIDAQREAVNRLYKEGTPEFNAGMESIREQEAAYRKLIDTMGELARAQSDPALMLQRKIASLDASLKEFTNTQQLAVNMSDEFQSALAGGFSNSVSTVVMGTGTIQQAVGNMFSNIAQMFIDMVARMLAQSAAKSILGLIGGGAPGGLFGSVGAGALPGFGLDQLVPSLFTGAAPLGFAKGGISSGPNSGYPAMLHGTEAIVPLPNGRGIPVEMKGGAGTSVVVNVNMQTGQTEVQSGERDGKLLGDALSQAVQAELVKQQRPGGLLYK